MKRKGFTLIELLAVIVILSVIALITIPIIGNIIEDSKKKALEQSANGIVEAANYFAISNDGDYHFIFSNEKKGVATTGENLAYKGSVDATGNLYIDSDGNISLCLMNENYYVYKNYNSGIYIGKVNDNTCIVGYDALTNKYIAMLDDGSGTVSNIYSRDDVDDLVTNLQSQITSNDKDIEQINNNVNALTTVVDTNSTNITELQNSLNTYALQTELDATNIQVNTNATNITTNTTSINNLQTQLSNVNSNLLKITTILHDASNVTIAAGASTYLEIGLNVLPLGIVGIAGLPSSVYVSDFYTSRANSSVIFLISNQSSSSVTLGSTYVSYLYV